MPLIVKEARDIPLYEPDRWIGHGNSGRVGGHPFSEVYGSLYPVSNQPGAVVGFDLWAGDLIDGIRAIYRDVNDDGTLGGKYVGKHMGGKGGRQFQVGYPYDRVVTGLRLNQGQYTDSLSVIWGSWRWGQFSGGQYSREWYGGSGGFPTPDLEAPMGFCAIGIHGKCGSLIDRISLIIGRFENWHPPQ